MHTSIIEHFNILPDPRRQNHTHKLHELTDIIVIAILATICGADTWVDIETFGQEKEEWLKSFLNLKNGIPSHDTFARVFSILDPEAFQSCFRSWAHSMVKKVKGEIIAIDGKTTRRSYGKNEQPLHIVSAFATANGITLGQLPIHGKTNEITAIPDLLETLYLKGCIVTIDAMGCQTEIAKKIAQRKGKYVLAVKGNQQKLLDDIQEMFRGKKDAFDYAETTEKSHGRIEKRECWSTDIFTTIRNGGRWKNLASVIEITDTRILEKKETTSTRYFISSLKSNASEALRAVREHWKVENSLHWTLDMVFREDESRIRIGHAQKNLALVRKIALNLLKKERESKHGIRAKRFQASLSNEYLLKVIGGV